LELIDDELDQTSKGLASPHHLHNVQSAIENILSLVEYDDLIADMAGRLIQTAADYINRHDIVPAARTREDEIADAKRFRAAQNALARFRLALERSRPNARVRTLRLG